MKRPIGIFDSGVGGLTLLKAVHEQLPNEDILYLGDLARLPYGTKSTEIVRKYALKVAEYLADQQVKLLLVACHTVSSVAMEVLKAHFEVLPVLGVLEPGVISAMHHSQNKHVLVVGTEGTIASKAYVQAIQQKEPHFKVSQLSCGLWVAMAEEGWLEGQLVEEIIRKGLAPLWEDPSFETVDTILLGCTHFPILQKSIQQVVGDRYVVDPAIQTTHMVKDLLIAKQLHNQTGNPGKVRLMVTDSPTRFVKVAQYFLGERLGNQSVELIHL